MWQALAVLIMDEVSMVEPAYLDWLDATVRSMRKTPDKAFGGMLSSAIACCSCYRMRLLLSRATAATACCSCCHTLQLLPHAAAVAARCSCYRTLQLLPHAEIEPTRCCRMWNRTNTPHAG